MRLIASNNLLEMLDRFGRLLLLAGNASQLIVRVDLFRIDLYGAFETLARRFQFAALLMKNISIRRKFQGQARADESPKPMRSRPCKIAGAANKRANRHRRVFHKIDNRRTAELSARKCRRCGGRSRLSWSWRNIPQPS